MKQTPNITVTAGAGHGPAPLHLVGGFAAPYLFETPQRGAASPTTHGQGIETRGPAMDDFVEFQPHGKPHHEIGRITSTSIGPAKTTDGDVIALNFKPLVEVVDINGQYHEIGTGYKILNDAYQDSIFAVWSIWAKDAQ